MPVRTVGTVRHLTEPSRWEITCEPHVMLRLKRVFARLKQSASGAAVLSDTEENCHELNWFLQRFPMTVDDQAHLDARAEAHERREADVARIVNADGYTAPAFEKLAITAREYQRVAADLVLRNGSLLLADDVGLGKTASAICVLSEPKALPALVVTLAHLPRQWEAEIKRFAPWLVTHVAKKGQPYDITKASGGKFPDVLILNYHKLAGWRDVLSGTVKTVIYDEAQELRHDGTAKSNAARHVSEQSVYRMGLSVGPTSVVELRGGPFNNGWVGSIAEAWRLVCVDEFVAADPDGYEVVRTEGVEARGWSGTRFTWKAVTSFIRHRCTRTTRTLRAAGDRLLLTDDHSVFVVSEDGSFHEAPAADVVKGDVVPVDDGAGWEDEFSQPALVDVTSLAKPHSKAQVLVDLSGTSRKALGVKPWQWHNFHREAKFGPRLPVALFLKHRESLPQPTGIYFSQCPRAQRISATIELSKWAYILGFFLGDGWLEKGCHRVAFAVESARVDDLVRRLRALPQVELNPTVQWMDGDSAEVRVAHTLFAEVLRASMGVKRCFVKTIPGEWVVAWPRYARLELLQGMVDSDGHVGVGGRRYFRTTSKGLARTLLSLLRSLGVVGGMTACKPRAGGTVNGRRIQGTKNSYCVHWSAFAERGVHDGKCGLRRRTKGLGYHEGVVRDVRPSDTTPEFVYDMEMQGHPSFVANGLLVHNTATPIYNYGGEIYNVISALRPDALGTHDEFMREWCIGWGYDARPGDKPRIKDPRAFGTYVRNTGLMLRRTRTDVGRELPALSRSLHHVDADTNALDKIGKSAAELAQIILKQGESKRGEKMMASEQLSNVIRQATGIAKAPYVADFVRLLVESGESVVLYGWHRECYSIWLDRLKDLKPVMFTGSETPAQKDVAKKAFCDGDSQVLIISLRAGAGLDGLQFKSRTIVFGELDWSPGVHEQCIGRVYRDGQPDPVIAYFLLADSGSDPIVADVLGLKKSQIDGIRDPNADIIETLEVEEDRIRKLAEAFLRQRGIPIPKPEPEPKP